MKKHIREILFFVLLFIFTVSAGLTLFQYLGQRSRNQIYEGMKETEAQTTEAVTTAAPESTQGEPETEEESAPPEIPVDFAALKEINPDIYAWIEIPGTEVSYPIVQDPEDDLYYLEHTIEGKKGYPGSIYTELFNAKDFQDANTILYGHNMRDDTMFGSLDFFRDPAYMAEHQEILIYTEEHVFTYRIFSAVTYHDRHLMALYDFEDPDQFMSFYDSVMNTRSMNDCVDRDISVEAGDRLLTLYTCVGAGDTGKRLLVVGVLTDEQ